MNAAEALDLYRSAPTAVLGRLADEIRQRKHPDGIVTYIIDRNVNYTNICVAKCNFCAFYREVGSPDGYVLGFDELFRKIDETIAVGGVQLLLQGGHNPDLPLSWYEDLFRAVKDRYPDLQAPRAVAAGSDPPVAPFAAAGAGDHRSARSPPDSTAFPAAAPRFWSIVSGRCFTATARPHQTNGSTSCVTRIAPACARRRR